LRENEEVAREKIEHLGNKTPFEKKLNIIATNNYFAKKKDYYVKSIYYVRCGSITLGYKVPISQKIAKNLRVYVDVNNPFVITNWTGLDPETDNGTYAYPNVTSYNFGVSISF
jgi:hypothetical protein